MSQLKKSILFKRKEDVLFITTPVGFFSPSTVKDIKDQLDNPDIHRTILYFDNRSEHENAVIGDICRLLIRHPHLEAKIFRRKNTLFLQRSLSETERLIRFPQGKIICSPQKFIYEGAFFKPKSRLFEAILATITLVQPHQVRFSLPVKRNTETNTEFLHRIADIRSLILKGLQKENTISDIQFFVCRNQKKELVDAYVRHDNFEIRRRVLSQRLEAQPLKINTSPHPLHVSKYQRKLLVRQITLQQAVNAR